MTKRRTYPSNGLKPSSQEPAQRGDEAPSALDSPDHQSEAEEGTPQELNDPSIHEDREASDALMESYNG